MADSQRSKTKWTEAHKKKMLASRAANAILRESASVARKARASHSPRIRPSAPPTLPQPTSPYDAHYAGETPAVDVNRLETKAFRNGLATALQMVIELLVRELR